MSFKQTDFCYECKEQPDNLLSLQCGHDLCLNCSSVQYYKFSYRKKNFICQICGKSTPLDHSSIYELEKLIISHPPEDKVHLIGEQSRNTPSSPYDNILQQMNKADKDMGILKNQKYNQQQKQQRNEDQNKIGWNLGYQEHSQEQPYQKLLTHESQHKKDFDTFENSRYQQISVVEDNKGLFIRLLKNMFIQKQYKENKWNNFQSKYMKQPSYKTILQKQCSEHDDEEVNYFCFDCKSNCICPECIIHGVHRDHNVKTIKKSYPIIKQILEDYRLDLENNIQLISNKKDSVYQQKNELLTIQKDLKLEITVIFNSLKQKVDETCQQLIQQTEDLTKKSLRDLDETIKQIDKHVLNFKKNNEGINEQLRFKEEDCIKILKSSNHFEIIYQINLLNTLISIKQQITMVKFIKLLKRKLRSIAMSICKNNFRWQNKYSRIIFIKRIKDQIFELSNLEKKYQNQIQLTSFAEDNEVILRETKKIFNQDRPRENSGHELKKHDLIDKKYVNPVSFAQNKQSYEGLGLSRQLDQDFERMKENLKKSSQNRSSSLKKYDNQENRDKEDSFLYNYNLRNNKI